MYPQQRSRRQVLSGLRNLGKGRVASARGNLLHLVRMASQPFLGAESYLHPDEVHEIDEAIVCLTSVLDGWDDHDLMTIKEENLELLRIDHKGGEASDGEDDSHNPAGR